ncbi:MAG: sigma-54-dependent Fis family transcriptional regulator [Burkholderiales bacterium]|nr:sigma-54-dependent Fis family transcriptional regulator [Burkholderiales bacterium]MBH2015143.1 sigma-54-dependent Fis family transcriptional regulator [Burkholderiales bacterium]
MATILVVDDELGIRALLSEILSDEGHSVEVAENAAQARTLREQCKPDLVLLDIWMPDVDGVTLLKEWSANGQLTMPVIMMSGHGTIDTAVEATKFGAQAFLEKPITMQKLLRTVEQGLTKPAPRQASTPVGLNGHGQSAGSASLHLATVTPITAASSYAGHGAPSLRTEMVHPSHTSLASHPTHAEMPHVASVAPVAYGAMGGVSHGHHAVAPQGNGMSSMSGLSAHSGPSHEQVFQLDRPLREARDDFERAYFEFHLAREGGSMTRVAEKTGLERTHLYRKLKQLGVDLGRNKKTAMN